MEHKTGRQIVSLISSEISRQFTSSLGRNNEYVLTLTKSAERTFGRIQMYEYHAGMVMGPMSLLNYLYVNSDTLMIVMIETCDFIKDGFFNIVPSDS